MFEPVKLAIGFDQRELIAAHTFCQSIIKHEFTPCYFYTFSH